jgi:hypothetical protein
MLHRGFVGNALRMGTAALVLSVALTPAAFAKGGPDKGKGFGDDRHSIPNCSRQDDDDRFEGRDRGDRLFCPNKQVLVRIDEKLCPEKPGRPAVVRKRVCCRHGSLTNCRPFRPCPPRSRS